jgi:hypothetical protein
MKASAISVIMAFLVIAVMVGISAYYYSQIYLGFFQDPLWVSVFVTTVLVIINGYYAWQVRKTIDEMKKAREAEFMPHIRAELSFFGLIPVMKITNFGKGPAINIKTKITFSGGETKPWEQTVMSPNESIHLTLPGANMNEILQRAAQIMVSGEYEDIFGKVLKIDDKMDTKVFIEQTQTLVPILEENLATLVKGIGSELGRIENELRSIKENLSRTPT